MLYQIQLQESGSGRVFNLTEDFVSLKRANKLVKELDERWNCLTEEGFLELPEDDILNHYEGCDIIAVGKDGRTFLILSVCEGEPMEGNWEEL